jgi:hypothetical protein
VGLSSEVYKAEEDDRSGWGQDMVVTCANDNVETQSVYAWVGVIVEG